MTPRSQLATFLRHFLRFGSVGVVVAVVQAGGYVLLAGLGLATPMQANVIAFFPATAVSFTAHYAWTFRSTRDPARAAWRFAVARLMGLGINAGAVYLDTIVLGLSHYWVLPVMLLLTPLSVFTICKYWVFRDTGHRRGGEGSFRPD
jgi:putative flippase GtrA